MLEQDIYKRHFVGRDGFIWWIGQVASSDSWARNTPDQPQESNTTIEGWGERYKVRIMGYHTAVKSELPDDDLPWASVMYPVTAGGGGKNAYANANLQQGNFVFGFFIDGEDGQQPVIMGCLGYNNYQEVMKNIPDTAFVPFSGYEPNELRANYGVLAVPGAQDIEPNQQADGRGIGDVANESTTGTQMRSVGDLQNAEKDPLVIPSAGPEADINVPGVQTNIQKAIIKVEKVRKSVYDIRYSLTTKINNIEKEITRIVKEASAYIASLLRTIYGFMEKQLLNGLVGIINKIGGIVSSPQINEIKKIALDGVPDWLACLFKKLMPTLEIQVEKWLDKSVKKIIKVKECFVENFISNILGKITGTILGFLGKVVNAISKGVTKITGLIDSVLGLILDILSFLTCSKRSEPRPARLHEWDFQYGVIKFGAKISDGGLEDLFNEAKDIATQTLEVVGDIQDDIEDISKFAVDLDFSNAFNSDECSVGPDSCGSPTIKVLGGKGSGAKANAVIGFNGEIIGVDVVAFGSGYTEGDSVIVKVNDSCGKGKNGKIKAIIGEVTKID